jgi:hypothetical protein
MSTEEKIWGELIVSAYFLDRLSPGASTAKENLTPITPLSFFATEPFCDMARASWQPAQFIRHPCEHGEPKSNRCVTPWLGVFVLPIERKEVCYAR